MYYGEYLQLDKILGAQDPESDKFDKEAHDEMLFIIIHQSYELWFKQVLYEVGSVMRILENDKVDDNSPQLQVIVHRMDRVIEILKLLVEKISIMETMTAMDFLDFRDLLRPASGFQSMQFKILETKLGLKSEKRFGKEYFVSQLKEEDRNYILNLENETSLIELINTWLERMPFFENQELWEGPIGEKIGEHPFWGEYSKTYADSLLPMEKNNAQAFEEIFLTEENDPSRRFSPRARRNALFIKLYRGYPIMQKPFSLLSALLDVDEYMARWRYRHVNMVHRIIGARVGTGGSTGKGYLKSAMDHHFIFTEIAELSSYLVEKEKLPKLSPKLEKRLGFVS